MARSPAGNRYTYDPQNGSRYAQAYALYFNIPKEKRIFFYDADGNDCSNFISQCIWAAYGGWIPSTDDAAVAQNKQRMKEYVREVAGVWYGSDTFSGPPNWCRVEGIFSYVTSKKAVGPSGEKVAEGTWENIDPGIIQKGDIVQLVVSGYASYRYGHSLYVTKQGATFDDILICCHSYDRLNAPLSSFSLYPEAYKKLRVLRLKDAVFAK
ncbi:MAG: amidase domain-containing protein [Bacillota bacterium]